MRKRNIIVCTFTKVLYGIKGIRLWSNSVRRKQEKCEQIFNRRA